MPFTTTRWFARSRPIGWRAAPVRAAVVAAAAISLMSASSQAVLVHEYRFNGDASDSVGGANGTLMGGANVADGRLNLDGLSSFVELPAATIGINTFSAVTLELWSTQPLIDRSFTFAVGFGTTNATMGGERYLGITTQRGSQTSRGLISNNPDPGLGEIGADGPELNDGLLHHYVLTFDNTNLNFYIDGVAQGGPVAAAGRTLAGLSNDFAYLGKSLFTNDQNFLGSIDEVSIWNNALTPAEVGSQFSAGPVGGSVAGPRLEVNRTTGAVSLLNGGAAQDMVRYSIASAAGSLNAANLVSIDSRDSNGTGTIDANDQWTVLSQTDTLISEEEPIGGGGFDDGAPFGNIPLGTGLWRKSPFEDLVANVTVLDSNTFQEVDMAIPVVYVGGAQLGRSDFNGDGALTAADYTILANNHLKTLAATSAAASFALGDTNGDLRNDYFDYRNFQLDFDTANGVGAFAALSGAAVPEPSAMALMLLAGVGAAGARRMRRAG